MNSLCKCNNKNNGYLKCSMLSILSMQRNNPSVQRASIPHDNPLASIYFNWTMHILTLLFSKRLTNRFAFNEVDYTIRSYKNRVDQMIILMISLQNTVTKIQTGQRVRLVGTILIQIRHVHQLRRFWGWGWTKHLIKPQHAFDMIRHT